MLKETSLGIAGRSCVIDFSAQRCAERENLRTGRVQEIRQIVQTCQADVLIAVLLARLIEDIVRDRCRAFEDLSGVWVRDEHELGGAILLNELLAFVRKLDVDLGKRSVRRRRMRKEADVQIHSRRQLS